MARLRNSGDADDVLQEVALAAWDKRQSLHDAEKVEPWLYRIAIRQVQMFWRKRKRKFDCKPVDLPMHQSLDVSDSDSLDPVEFLTSQEVHQQVRDALAELGPQDREILLLKHVEDWTYQQISDRLNVSFDKVIYRLARARNRMKEKLNVHEHEMIDQ